MPKPKRKPYSKFRNIKVEQDGIMFDSQLERDYYLYLKIQAKAKEIKGFTLQPRFELIPKFIKYGKTFRKTEYVGDFEVFMNNGTVEVLDVKGAKETDVFKIKRKLLELQNYEVDFYIVRREHGVWVKKR